MKSRQFLNVVMQDHCGGSLMSRIIDPKKHLFYPSTAEALQHLQIQQQAATKTTDSTWEASPVDRGGDRPQAPRAQAWGVGWKSFVYCSYHCSYSATVYEGGPGRPAGLAPPLPVEEVYNGVLRLTPPMLGFRPSSTPGGSMGPGLFPFYGGIRGGESRILCIDRAGMASIYDANSGTIQMMPGLADKKGGWPLQDIISLCVTDDADTTHSSAYPVDPDVLYVMDSASRSFQALSYGDPDQPISLRHTGCRKFWHWCRLPRPPVIVRHGDSNSVWCSYALLDGHGNGSKHRSSSTILVSFSRSYYGRARAVSIGTYYFDTGKGKWSKAGDWTLPFWSRAFHVPELGDGLLFGIDNKHFLAMDIFGATKTDKKCAPVLQHAWVDVDVDPLLDWRLRYYSVAYLGEGRFCIHRSFEVMETDGWGSGEECVDTVVLLTGVEVVRDGSGLQMIKHKSRRLDSDIYYVL